MLKYLENYNLSIDQIINVEKIIKERELNIDVFKFDPEKIISILDLFVSIGVTNIYNIIITNPSMFCDTVESIERRINKYIDKKELSKLLNDDSNNLSLIGLM